MKIIIRHSLSVIVLTVIALRIYLHDPQPQYSGKKEVPGLNSPVEIFTDNYGVPHIFAENESDLFFAAGYQTARDRLFQLSLVISASRGTLASFFGNDYLTIKIKIYIYFSSTGLSDPFSTSVSAIESLMPVSDFIFSIL